MNGATTSTPLVEGHPVDLDFESFHISSRPVSRRASPIPLTPLATSFSQHSAASSVELSSAPTRSPTPLSSNDSGAVHGPHSHRPETIGTLDSLPNIRRANVANPVLRPALGISYQSPSIINNSRNSFVRHETLPGAEAGLGDDGVYAFGGVQGESTGNAPPAEAWNICVKVLRDYDEHMVRGWKEDVDSLLVFAGLFSAVVTTFNIEAYKFLQEDPEETSADILKQISAQLAATSGSTVVPTLSRPPFQPDPRSIRINILWFASLVLSLVSASIGILTKQWLREYISNTASSARENARIRQLRYEGFVTWRIPLTIALLPILLQIALALFFIGLLDLLWSLDRSVASVITVIVTISLSFLVVTTLLPTVRGDCPYKSPQALGVFLVYQGLSRLSSILALKVYTILGWNRRAWPLYIDTALFRRRRRRFAGWLHTLIHQKQLRSWRDREKCIVREAGATLDRNILAGADETFMDDEFLERVLRACLSDTDSPAAVSCLHQIVTHRADRIDDGVPHWKHCDDVDGGVILLLHLVVDTLPRIDRGDDGAIIKTLKVADHLCRAIPFEIRHADTVVLYQRLFDNLARFLAHAEPVQRCSFDLMRSVWYRSKAPVQSTVIQHLATFARSAKAASDLVTFQLASEMALAFATSPNLPRIVFNGVRDDIRGILEDLEGHLAEPAASDLPGQTASILLALEELAALDPDLISPALLHILDRVRLENAVRSDGDSMASFMQRRLASAIALRRHRERRPRWPAVRQRRNAIDVRGANDVAALNLQLPSTPERRPEEGLGASNGETQAAQGAHGSPHTRVDGLKLTLPLGHGGDGSPGESMASRTSPSDHRHQGPPSRLSPLAQIPPALFESPSSPLPPTPL